MLTTHRDEVLHRWVVAFLHVGAQELAALREAQRVDSGCRAENGLVGELGADRVELGG